MILFLYNSYLKETSLPPLGITVVGVEPCPTVLTIPKPGTTLLTLSRVRIGIPTTTRLRKKSVGTGLSKFRVWFPDREVWKSIENFM